MLHEVRIFSCKASWCKGPRMCGCKMATEMFDKAMSANTCLITLSDVGLQESAFQGPSFHWKGPMPSAVYWPLLSDCRICVSVQHCSTSLLLPFIQGTVTVLKCCYIFRNFCSILDSREKCFSVKLCCKPYGFAELLVTTLGSVGKLISRIWMATGKKFSPETPKDF